MSFFGFMVSLPPFPNCGSTNTNLRKAEVFTPEEMGRGDCDFWLPGGFVCEYCGVKFPTREEMLEAHLKWEKECDELNEEDENVCPHCDREYE